MNTGAVMASEINGPAALAGDREIVMTWVFDAPREVVFGAFTDPKHLAAWWGPNGFTLTTERMEVRVGGEWVFVMHGPDGRDYPNKITYLEVAAPERLVYRHGGEKGFEPVRFEVRIEFEALAERRTRMKWRMTFPSGVARDHVIKTYGALDGLTQTVGRLGEFVASRASAN